MSAGKSRVEILKEIEDFETVSKQKTKKLHRWYVCYFYADKPHIWRMMSARAMNESDAWEYVKKHIVKDGNSENARLKYANRVDADDYVSQSNKRKRKASKQKVAEESDEKTKREKEQDE